MKTTLFTLLLFCFAQVGFAQSQSKSISYDRIELQLDNKKIQIYDLQFGLVNDIDPSAGSNVNVDLTITTSPNVYLFEWLSTINKPKNGYLIFYDFGDTVNRKILLENMFIWTYRENQIKGTNSGAMQEVSFKIDSYKVIEP